MPNTIKTRFLVLSDTHGATQEQLHIANLPPVDVAIHWGDLTQTSIMEEYLQALYLLASINAPLKLVIPGNHDWSLDPIEYRRKFSATISASHPAAESFTRTYGPPDAAVALFNSPNAAAAGITYLNEGTHKFTLANGASLTVSASPYTPMTLPGFGFQYVDEYRHHKKPRKGDGHRWAIGKRVDIAITHIPPAGVLDTATPMWESGCHGLFAKMAKARPMMHCFGHVHNAWGAVKVRWRGERWYKPLCAILGPSWLWVEDQEVTVVEELGGRNGRQWVGMDYVAVRERVKSGKESLFVNALVDGSKEIPWRPVWIVDLELDRAL